MRTSLPAGAVLAALLAASPATAAAPSILAVRASRLFLADGSSLPDAVVLVKDGVVAGIGSGLPVPREARLVEAPVATAGFADLWTRVPGGHDAEDPRPFAPALRVSDGIDPADRAARAAAREGVLYRVVLPSERNPLGGRAAALRVSGEAGLLVLAAADAGGAISLTAAAARRERFPGSLAGILRGVGSCFEAAGGARGPFSGADTAIDLGPADRAALAALAGGGSPSWLFARSRAEVRAAAALAAERRLAPVLVDPRCRGAEILDAARAAGLDPAGLRVVLALDLDDPSFRLEAPAALAAAGVRVGFGSGGPWRGPDALRFMAALAVRHGMATDAARDALLGRGLALPGRPARGLEAGSPADLVLLDGDPVDPASRVTLVIAGGEVLR